MWFTDWLDNRVVRYSRGLSVLSTPTRQIDEMPLASAIQRDLGLSVS